MVEVAASIVGLTAFGTQIVSQLYKFGSNVSATREQTARIGDRISDYMTILDVLEGVIDQDPSFISTKAEDLVDRLCDQSYDLFDEIRALLPRGRDKLTLKDKVAWNFRKAKVELMLGQIEYIKSNVLLLVMTTLLGKKIRSRRKQRQKSNDKTQDDQVEKQEARANNIVVQHVNAAEKLVMLEKELERSDNEQSLPGDRSTDVIPCSNTSIELMSRQVNVIAAFQRSMASVPDAASRQSLMIQRSPQLVNDLLREWTQAYEPSPAENSATTGQGESRNTATATRDWPDDHRRSTAASSASDTGTTTQGTTPAPDAFRSARRTTGSDRSRRFTAARTPTYGEKSLESSDTRAWETSFDKTRAYMEKAAASNGHVPQSERHESGSFWSSTSREKIDEASRPTTKEGRYSYEWDEVPRSRPAAPRDRIRKQETARNSDDDYVSIPVPPVPREPSRARKPTRSRYQTVEPESEEERREARNDNVNYVSIPVPPLLREPNRVQKPTRSRYQPVEPESEEERREARNDDVNYVSIPVPLVLREPSRDRKPTKSRYQTVESESEEEPRETSPRRRTSVFIDPKWDTRMRQHMRPVRPHSSTTQSHVRGKASRDAPPETP